MKEGEREREREREKERRSCLYNYRLTSLNREKVRHTDASSLNERYTNYKV